MSEQIDVQFPADGTAVFEGRRGQQAIYHPTDRPDVFTLFGRPDPSQMVSLIRCHQCGGWDTQAVAALDVFFCADCAKAITSGFHRSRLSDQYEPPRRGSTKPQDRRS